MKLPYLSVLIGQQTKKRINSDSQIVPSQLGTTQQQSKQTSRTKLKAITVKEFGSEDVLKLEKEQSLDKPKEKQCLVKIESAGVNPVDALIRKGFFSKECRKYTPGLDGSGVVEEAGPGSKFKKGDRVYVGKNCPNTTGTYAQYALVGDKSLHLLPDNVSFDEAAALWVAYYTAYHALIQIAGGVPGQTVLVHGASGGVGLAAVQIAKARGLRVLGTAGSQEGLELIKKHGCQQAFNHKKEGYQQDIQKYLDGSPLNIILEMAAGYNLDSDLDLISANGTIVIIGSHGNLQVTPVKIMMKTATIRGVVLGKISDEQSREVDSAVFAGLQNGSLKPIIQSASLPDAPLVSLRLQLFKCLGVDCSE